MIASHQGQGSIILLLILEIKYIFMEDLMRITSCFPQWMNLMRCHINFKMLSIEET